MSYTKTHYLSVFVPSVLFGFIAALTLTGCGESPAGLPGSTAGSGGEIGQGGADQGSGGSQSNGDAGAKSDAGEAGEAAGGATPDDSEAGSPSSGGTDGVAGNGSGGTNGGSDSGGGASASGGQGGTLIEAVIPPTCPFHTDPIDPGGAGGMPGAGGNGGTAGAGVTGGAGGSAGAPGPALTVTLQTSPFVGTYLADAAGRTLYTFGNDLPGDCHTPPVSNCVTDCLISWPIFPAGARVLAPGLDDAAFGAIHRDDGTWQTTYYGWPLYYYKTDLLLGQVAGQAKGKTWHIVEKKLPAVFIMKPQSLKYLADASGHTLYVSANDQAGSAASDPVSNCTGSCLTTFEPFHEKNFSVVTSLLIADFASFVRADKGSLQVSYKGMPLYRAVTDLKSGDMNGTAVSGFTAAVP